MNQPRVIRNEMNLCEAESCRLSSGSFWVLHIHQGFISVFQCLFLLQLLYRYRSVAHILQRTSESLAGLFKRFLDSPHSFRFSRDLSRDRRICISNNPQDNADAARSGTILKNFGICYSEK